MSVDHPRAADAPRIPYGNCSCAQGYRADGDKCKRCDWWQATKIGAAAPLRESRAGEPIMCPCGHSHRKHGVHGCLDVTGLLTVCPCTVSREDVLLATLARLTEAVAFRRFRRLVHRLWR